MAGMVGGDAGGSFGGSGSSGDFGGADASAAGYGGYTSLGNGLVQFDNGVVVDQATGQPVSYSGGADAYAGDGSNSGAGMGLPASSAPGASGMVQGSPLSQPLQPTQDDGAPASMGMVGSTWRDVKPGVETYNPATDAVTTDPATGETLIQRRTENTLRGLDPDALAQLGEGFSALRKGDYQTAARMVGGAGERMIQGPAASARDYDAALGAARMVGAASADGMVAKSRGWDDESPGGGVGGHSASDDAPPSGMVTGSPTLASAAYGPPTLGPAPAGAAIVDSAPPVPARMVVPAATTQALASGDTWQASPDGRVKVVAPSGAMVSDSRPGSRVGGVSTYYTPTSGMVSSGNPVADEMVAQAATAAYDSAVRKGMVGPELRAAVTQAGDSTRSSPLYEAAIAPTYASAKVAAEGRAAARGGVNTQGSHPIPAPVNDQYRTDVADLLKAQEKLAGARDAKIKAGWGSEGVTQEEKDRQIAEAEKALSRVKTRITLTLPGYKTYPSFDTSKLEVALGGDEKGGAAPGESAGGGSPAKVPGGKSVTFSGKALTITPRADGKFDVSGPAGTHIATREQVAARYPEALK